MKAAIRTGSLNILKEYTYILDILSHIYRTEVTIEFLTDLKKICLPEDSENSVFNKGAQLLNCYLGKITDESVVELRVDFTRLFIARPQREPIKVFPHESAYTSQLNRNMDQARDSVIEAYKKNGVKSTLGSTFGEDHICVELSFVSFLLDKLTNALEGSDLEESEYLINELLGFIDSHLLNWISELVHNQDAVAHTDFYKGIGYLTLGTIKLLKVELLTIKQGFKNI